MDAQVTMPYPLERMLGHLDLNVGSCFESMPEKMEDAMVRCRRREMFCTCDEDLESRYFLCPNRGLLDRLESTQGII